MDFFSPLFFVFFLLVLFIYYIINNKGQKIVLFLSSSLFVGLLSVSFLLYTYISILANYLIALQTEKYNQNARIKKIISNSGILLNIGALVFFKYLGFIIYSVDEFLHLFNFSVSLTFPDIIIPLGISYYTFQGISYLLQVYRGIEKAEKNIIVFSNYFLLFPKFLAGPIELSKKLIPQLNNIHSFYYPDILDGLKQILWGAFKKMVIADRLAMLINGVYPNLEGMSGNILIFTFILQPLQIYCDFSGYTDIAVGIGKTLGFKLTDNFNRPFFSTNVSMFWQRWHISLTAWCNEFIFRRLIFKRRKWGLWASVYSVFITFLVIGLWHGPRWNYIILGLLQGIAINYEFFTRKFRLKIAGMLPKKLVLFLSYIVVYLFFCFTLIFFNATKVSDSLYFISHMFVNINFSDFYLEFLTRFDKIIVLISLIFLFIVEFRQERGKNIFDEIGLWPRWIRTLCYYVICILIIYFGSPVKEFVYMQF